MREGGRKERESELTKESARDREDIERESERETETWDTHTQTSHTHTRRHTHTNIPLWASAGRVSKLIYLSSRAG